MLFNPTQMYLRTSAWTPYLKITREQGLYEDHYLSPSLRQMYMYIVLTNVKFEVNDSTWPGVLKKLDPVLSALFKEGVLMTSIKLGSVNRILMMTYILLVPLF